MRGAETAWLGALVHAHRELLPLLEDHLDYNEGEILPHLFMSDIVRWMIDNLVSNPTSCRSILDWLEQEFPDAPSVVQDMIVVSGLELIPHPDEDGAALREMLGPVLRDADTWEKPLSAS